MNKIEICLFLDLTNYLVFHLLYFTLFRTIGNDSCQRTKKLFPVLKEYSSSFSKLRFEYETIEEDIKNNPTVFGKILKGALNKDKSYESKILYEDSEFLAFRNIKPYAKLTALVIPKRFILQSPDDLSPEHLDVIIRMKEIAEQDIVKKYEPEAYSKKDYWLRFHRPPHNSVKHLHLHILAPRSEITKWETLVVMGDAKRSCDVGDVINRMNKDKCKT